ncbi:MAG: hypothetical protein ACPGTU_19935 [Myxococcota bacterium]
MSDKPPVEPLPPRSKAATVFMAVPIVFIGALGVLVALLWVVTGMDSFAEGEQVTIRFDSACGERSSSILVERARQIGMDPVMSGLDMTVHLPDLPDARTAIPELLVTPGVFTLSSNDEALAFDNEHIDEIAIDLDEVGMPQTLVKLDAGARTALIDIADDLVFTPTLDNETLPTVTGAELKDEGVLAIYGGDGITAVKMRRAADRAIVLEHGPMPCAVRVISVDQPPNAG